MKKRSKLGTLFRMLGLVKPLSGFMCLAVLCGTLAFLSVEAIPVVGVWGIFSGDGGSAWLWITLLALALGRSVLRYTEQKTNHYIAFTLLAIIRDRVFAAMRKLCPAKLEGRDKGDLISLITSDVELLEVFYAHTISPICIAVLCSTVMCVFLGAFHPLLALYALVAYIITGVLLPVIMSKRSTNL